jgi:hypothetical protein
MSRGFDGYHQAKTFDGIAGEWTYQLFVHRAMKFHGWPTPVIYEYLDSYESILDVIGVLLRLDDAVTLDAFGTIKLTLEVFAGIYDAPKGVLRIPARNERFVGRHAVAVRGTRRGGNELAFANSWGVEWGDEGYGYVSRKYVDRYATEAWLTRVGRRGPPPEWLRVVLGTSSRVERVSAWHREARRSTYPATNGVRIGVWSVALLGGAGTLKVIEATNREDVCIAWAHALKYEDDSKLYLCEFFVWPPFRRRGLASLLLQWISQNLDADEIMVEIHDADEASSRLNEQVSPQSVAQSVGFETIADSRWMLLTSTT